MVFTNGCFSLLHVGHVRYLVAARREGDYLVVAINSDDSIGRLKGGDRLVVPQNQRARLMASFSAVDYVTVFDEDTPLALLEALRPEVLVKGGNYDIEGVVGREIVWQYGGTVKTVAPTQGASSTNLVKTILERAKAAERAS